MLECVDLEKRDPKGLNHHIKVKFENVLAEPVGIHSLDWTWNCVHSCYTGSRDCLYATLTFLSGLCLALCWGCQYGLIYFNHIWCITPIFYLNVNMCECCYRTIGHTIVCIIAPVCDTFGILFSQIQIEKRRAK